MGGGHNALAWGVGATEYAGLIFAGFTAVKVPESIRFELHGELGPGVAAKDLILYILSTFAVSEDTLDRVMEFGGPALASISVDERATLTNMATECSARSGICEGDEKTIEWIMAQRPDADADALRARIVQADEGADVGKRGLARCGSVFQPRHRKGGIALAFHFDLLYCQGRKAEFQAHMFPGRSEYLELGSLYLLSIWQRGEGRGVSLRWQVEHDQQQSPDEKALSPICPGHVAGKVTTPKSHRARRWLLKAGGLRSAAKPDLQADIAAQAKGRAAQKDEGRGFGHDRRRFPAGHRCGRPRWK